MFWGGSFSTYATAPIDNPQLQACLHPLILAQAKDLGIQALLKIADVATLTQRYSTIKQDPKEPYIQFIERLRDAMDKQMINNDARNQLILQLAWDNANEDCKRAIDLLPKENPSLSESIDVCAKVRTDSYNMALLADSFAATVGCHIDVMDLGNKGTEEQVVSARPTD